MFRFKIFKGPSDFFHSFPSCNNIQIPIENRQDFLEQKNTSKSRHLQCETR